MFEISSDDIASLNDSELRELVGLLCEAELASHGLPTAGVTWGGSQDASDGGVDVRVSRASLPYSDGFIPKTQTIFQVKKPDMPPAAIGNEMCSGGALRDSIKEIAAQGGAYIIVSSAGTTTDSALKKRVQRMREIISTDYALGCFVDFYDRNRLASWVRSYPGIAIWVREKCGRKLEGWKPYGNWANCPQGIEEEYLSDDKIRIHGPNLPHEGASGLDGIKAIQKTLLEATDAVRLIGLSGVGKTRLAQALFDHRLSDSPLASHQVCYTDTSYSPSPSPLALAERLVTIGGTAILIVDNCAPDLHTQLTNACQLKTSKVKLITIEYDIKEDQAESTNVFRLEPSSDALIAKLIETRFKAVGYANAHTIAEFAGGNARVAISLATTVKKGESLSTLKDSELFDRLFRQRNQPDVQLKEVAEICSLVYSFNAGEDDDNEIATLCSLTDMSERTFYKKVSELLRRDLAQQRGDWRAILPHAIANRLAGLALDNFRQSELTSCFSQAGKERLLGSFAKRIGFLHEHPKAVAIAQEWLSRFGLVGNVPDLNDLGRAIFFNLAPAAPEAALQALEEAETHERASTFFSRENLYFTEIVNLLCSLAYEPALFSRSVRLLTRFALTERIDENNNSIRRRIRQLFSLILSGTQATAQDRYGEIDHLLKSGDIDKERIGLQWLDASLKTRNFSLDSLPKFGARTREVYSVSISEDEYREWYRLFINTTLQHITSNSCTAEEARQMLANRFRGLWLAGFSEELVDAVQMITTHCGHWNEAVYAINDLLRFDFETASVEEISALNTLKNSLLPSALEYRIHLCLCGDFRYSDLFLEGDTESESKQAALATQELGKELASDSNTFASLLPKILEYDSGQLFDLGHGVAMHSPNKATWHVIYETFSLLPEQGKAIRFVLGFLYSLADMKSELANSILDQSLTDIYLSKYFMLLQKQSPLDEKAIKRIIDSIHIGTCQTYWYKLLGYGKVHKQLSDDDLYLILNALTNKNDSIEVMLEILYMRLEKPAPYSSITQIALRLISQADSNAIRIMDYQISSIIESCIDTHSPEKHAPEIFDNIISQLKDRLSILDCQYILEKLAQWWPCGFIKKFVLSDSCSSVPYCDYHDSEYGLWKYLAMIDEEVIHDCCAPDPQANYLKMAKALNPKVRTEEGGVCWTPLALNMLEQHDSPTELLDIFKITLEPMSCRGSRAEIMEQNLPLFDQLLDHKDKRVRDWATTNKSLFADRVKKEKQSEEKEERAKFERFE